jgi:uncharacterized protein HemY
MKKAGFVLLLLSMGVILFFFIKEQFRGIDLSHIENMLLSISYFGFAVAFIILWRAKSLEKKEDEKNEQHLPKKNKG